MGSVAWVFRELNSPSGLGNSSSIISSYRQYFNRRIRIIPSKIDKIRQLYNTWINHYHSYYDRYYVRYENTAAHYTSGTSRSSGHVKNASAHNDTIIAGPSYYKLFSGRIFDLISKFNAYVGSHTHVVRDDIGPTN